MVWYTPVPKQYKVEELIDMVVDSLLHSLYSVDIDLTMNWDMHMVVVVVVVVVEEVFVVIEDVVELKMMNTFVDNHVVFMVFGGFQEVMNHLMFDVYK